jgi:N-acetylmuramoyl-L-alanine amidase
MPWIEGGASPSFRRFSLVLVAVAAFPPGFLSAQQQTAPAAHPQPPAAAIPPVPAVAQPPAAPAAAAQPPAPEPRYLVLLDPAHGGRDTGALLSGGDPEKSYTLALVARLRSALNARGIRVISTRQSDVDVDDITRATTANHSRAAACILLHATSTGNGVHLFTSSLSPTTQPATHNPQRAFLPWETAQSSFETQSLRLESDINTSLGARHIPALLERTSQMPLDSMECPAVAVEVAPLNANTQLSDASYQQSIIQSLTAALLAWRRDWGLQP